MQLQQLHQICLSYKATEATNPFGPDTLVYKVRGKIFLICSITDVVDAISIKCDPEAAIQQREQYPEVQPGYHLNKKHWNTIQLNGSLKRKQVIQWITDSYNLVVSSLPKAVQQVL